MGELYETNYLNKASVFFFQKKKKQAWWHTLVILYSGAMGDKSIRNSRSSVPVHQDQNQAG